MKQFSLWPHLIVSATLLGACGGSGASDDDNSGLAPIVDADASGWLRIKSIPPQGPIGIGTRMELMAATRIDGSFHLLTQELRGLQGGAVGTRFALAFDAASPLDAAEVTIKETSDPFMSGGQSADYRYYFKPGTADLYQSFRETTASGGFAETWSGLRTPGVTVGELRSSGGGNFAGLADLYADGTGLIPGADLNSAYFRDGAWTRIYGRYSDIDEPTTFSSYPVELEDGMIYWAMLQPTAIAIGARAPRPMIPGDEQVKTLLSLEQPADYVPSICYARAFADQVVFFNIRVDSGVSTVSAYRWTEGASAIETLYSNVQVPPEYPVPSVLDNQPHRLLIDAGGGLTFFAFQMADGAPIGTALIHVDATGAHTVGRRIPNGPYLVQGPWLIDGELYAGIGALETRETTQLDFVLQADADR